MIIYNRFYHELSSVGADEVRGVVKIFNLTQKDSFNYNHPLCVLYTIAAGAFLGKIGSSAKKNRGVIGGGSKKKVSNGWSKKGKGNSPGTWSGAWSGPKGGCGSGRVSDTVMPRTLDMREREIANNKNDFQRFQFQFQYIENETLRARFVKCKKYFQDKGIPDGERLIFHGTKPENIDSIIENGLLLSKCVKMAYGQGIYFSEFPEVARKYGDVLVVSRVMLGRPYRGQVKEIPEGFNCKIVERSKGQNAGIILVDQEEQILPTFIVKGNCLKDLM